MFAYKNVEFVAFKQRPYGFCQIIQKAFKYKMHGKFIIKNPMGNIL